MLPIFEMPPKKRPAKSNQSSQKIVEFWVTTRVRYLIIAVIIGCYDTFLRPMSESIDHSCESVNVLQIDEVLYSYAVITVDAHKQLSWMHDRMPVISYLFLLRLTNSLNVVVKSGCRNTPGNPGNLLEQFFPPENRGNLLEISKVSWKFSG